MATTGYPSDWEQRKRLIRRRDDHTCQECGRQGGPNGYHELHVHHVVPKSQGGSHEPENLVTLCAGCHSSIHGRPVGSAALGRNDGGSGRDWKWGGPLDHGVVALLTGWWSFGAGNALWAGACRLGSFSWNPLKWGKGDEK